MLDVIIGNVPNSYTDEDIDALFKKLTGIANGCSVIVVREGVTVSTLESSSRDFKRIEELETRLSAVEEMIKKMSA